MQDELERELLTQMGLIEQCEKWILRQQQKLPCYSACVGGESNETAKNKADSVRTNKPRHRRRTTIPTKLTKFRSYKTYA